MYRDPRVIGGTGEEGLCHLLVHSAVSNDSVSGQ